MSRLEMITGKPYRKFYELALERKMVVFFPPPLGSSSTRSTTRSPLSGVTKEQFEASDAES